MLPQVNKSMQGFTHGLTNNNYPLGLMGLN